MMVNTEHGNEEMVIITINIPRKLRDYLEKLKVWGIIPSRSEVLRHACIEYCLKLQNLMKFVDKENEPEYDPKKYVRIPRDDNTYEFREILRRLD